MKKSMNLPVHILLRRVFLAVIDCGLIGISFYIGLLLRSDGETNPLWFPQNLQVLYEHLPWILAIYLIVYVAAACTPFCGSTPACAI